MDTDSHWNRWKPFRHAVFESYSTTTISAWELDAPRAALDFVPTCLARVRRCEEVDWKRNKKLDDNDKVCHETRVLVDIVYFGFCFDQLNAGSLSVFELACRGIQSVISAFSNASKVNWSVARLRWTMECSRHSVATQHVVRQESRWDQVEASMEFTMELTTGPANLQLVVKKAVVLRGRVGNQGTPAPHRPQPGNHDVSGTGVVQAGGSRIHRTQAVLVPGQMVPSCRWFTQDFLPTFLDGLSTR